MNSKKAWIVACAAFGLAACQRVPAGHVGVKVHLLGSSKGVDTEELGPGRYWVGMNEELYLFPTFSQTDTWGGQQAVLFQTTEGLSVQADVGITYRVLPNKVTSVFQKYRKGIEEISDLYLRNIVRDGLVKAASVRGIETIYGKGKSELLEEVERTVQQAVEPIGIEVENLYWVGELRLPQAVVNSINAKIAATQEAQQRENEVAKATADAQIKIEQARGISESNLIIARAEGEALKIRGEALKENPDLITLNAVERWDGHMPHVMAGGAVPFLDVLKTENK